LRLKRLMRLMRLKIFEMYYDSNLTILLLVQDIGR